MFAIFGCFEAPKIREKNEKNKKKSGKQKAGRNKPTSKFNKKASRYSLVLYITRYLLPNVEQ